ncbi:YncE family protein [Streptomyces sp. ISL-1]|uniref:YncE family protein n=1 Tax=Streptomyces sp. ISL-1 TaxID=2817657 RepID=UPI001BE66F42|nr:YncE family protein [Streptomyces sp. ISL-1]MBT2388643.1 YncE family protein [Streptomyces sp. ISL-1]
MSRTRTSIHRRVLLAAAISATCALGPAGMASAAAPAQVHTRQASYTVDSAELGQGLYQSAYSARNNVLWVTSSVGFPPVTQSQLLKVDPGTLKVQAAYTPPLKDEATGAREAVYGVAVDDAHNTVWTTNTLDNSLAVYSQRTGRHLASLPGVKHARDVIVDEQRNLAWATGLEDGSVVAFDTRTYQQKRRVTVEGAGPAGLALDQRTGTVYAADLMNSRLIEVSPTSDEPRLIPAGRGSIDVSVSADGRTAYTANQAAGSVSVIDLRAGVVRKEIATGAGSLAVATDVCTGNVFVANRGSGTTTVVDPRNGTVLADLSTGANTDHVVVTRGTAYVLDKAAAGAGAVDSIHRIRVTG